MNYTELQQLISSGEHRELELKKSTGELKEGMHTACAFLNTDGGWLIFGVSPNALRTIGQQITDSTQREIAQALSGIEPCVDVRVEYVDIPDASNGEKIIAMHFDAWVWGEVPYTYHGCPYFKVESTTKQMSREMFEDRLRAARPQQFAWERQVADGYTMADLDESRIQGVVRLGVQSGRLPAAAATESQEHILTKWDLMVDGQPTNGAVALFGKRMNGYPQLMLKMARFRGMDKTEFIDNLSVDGNFFDLLDAGMAFLFKHLNLSGVVKGVMREEHLDIPAEALREALTNALCHRQYERHNLFTSIAIYDDRVEIDNPGHLPNELTIESIKLPHKSFPYNLLMAKVLYMSTFLESWGSGVKRMMDLCAEAGLREPEFVQDGSFVMIRLWKKITEKQSVCVGENLARMGENTKITQLTDLQQSIINEIHRDGNVTAKSLARMLNVGQRTVEREISNLRHRGIIAKTGKTNDGKWIIIRL